MYQDQTGFSTPASVSSASQLACQTNFGNGIPSNGDTQGTQELEKSFLEEIASIDLVPPMQGYTAIPAGGSSVEGSTGGNANLPSVLSNLTPLANTFVSQPAVSGNNTFVQNANSTGSGFSSNATSSLPIDALLATNWKSASGIPGNNNSYNGPDTQMLANTPIPGNMVPKTSWQPVR